MGARRKEISVVKMDYNQVPGWRNYHIPKDWKRLSGGMEIYENDRKMNALQYIGLGIAIGAVVMLLVIWLVAGYNEKKNREFGDH